MARYTATGEGRVIGTTVELSARTKDGDEIPIELSLSTWTVREERYYTGIIRDIGERKRAEEALRRSEQALRDRQRELKRKNEELEETLKRLREMHDQMIIQEKMASLGKLSAGMAHELNNPASAAQRGAAQLQSVFSQLQGIQLRLGEHQLEPGQLTKLVELYQVARERARTPAKMKPLTRSDREAALEEWLTRMGVDTSGELVPSLVSLDHRERELEALRELFPDHKFSLVVDWLSCMYAIYSLVDEINLGAGRISEVVKALKTYTHMDQAPVQSVDVREGLENTLIILHSKLKSGVTVVRDYAEDLPLIEAYPSELNQVWTNLIDNAIDAMRGEGTLVVRTRREDAWAVVEIEDNGGGIPEEIQSRIFDPFFTTKGPGEGTGLGLNLSRNLVVQKHRGQMSVESQPGRTCFSVRLPIDFHPTE
jgi:signal transduction histidine kinase